MLVALLVSLGLQKLDLRDAVVWLPNTIAADSPRQAPWARAVDTPVLVRRAARPAPSAESIAIVTWNVHGRHGRLLDFVAQLRSGRVTGRPVPDFVLLLQEVVRAQRAPVPLARGMKRAGAIRGGDAALPDIVEVAEALGLSLMYVPSMRNGPDGEDRGNAILSTMALDQTYAFELPFRRQRRVGVAATLTVIDEGMPRPLRVVNVHLDTSEGRGRLWVLGNPRPAQAHASVEYLAAIGPPAPLAVIGGDFNTFLPFEDAANDMRREWSRYQGNEDDAPTRGQVRLDYLFFRLEAELCGGTTRARSRFGSDHYPVIGQFNRGAACR